MSAARVESLLLGQIFASRRSIRSIAGVMALGAALVGLVPVGYLGPGWTLGVKLLIVGLFLVAATGLVLPTLRAAHKHPVLEVVRRRPDDIVWAYLSKRVHYGAPVAARLVLGLANGRRVTVEVDPAQDSELMRAVSMAAPCATVGYEPAHAAAFRADPASLRRELA